jgi:hypothetical protein
MKNTNNTNRLLLMVLMVIGFAFVSQAQQKTWSGNQTRYRIDSTTNATSVINWSIKGGATNGTGVAGGGRGANYATTWTYSGASKLTDSVLVSETVSSCIGENQAFGVTIYPNPTPIYKNPSNVAVTSVTASCPLSSPGDITIEMSNFVAGSLGDLGTYTINYELKDAGVTVSGSAGSVTTIIATATVTGASLAAYLSNTAATSKNYTLVITGISATNSLTPAALNVGAVGTTAINAISPLTIVVSAKPSTSAITPY